MQPGQLRHNLAPFPQSSMAPTAVPKLSRQAPLQDLNGINDVPQLVLPRNRYETGTNSRIVPPIASHSSTNNESVGTSLFPLYLPEENPQFNYCDQFKCWLPSVSSMLNDPEVKSAIPAQQLTMSQKDTMVYFNSVVQGLTPLTLAPQK